MNIGAPMTYQFANQKPSQVAFGYYSCNQDRMQGNVSNSQRQVQSGFKFGVNVFNNYCHKKNSAWITPDILTKTVYASIYFNNSCKT